MDGREAWTRYELVRDADRIGQLLAQLRDKPVELDFGPAAKPAIPATLTRGSDGWQVVMTHMDQTASQTRGAPSSIVLRDGGQRLETPCNGIHEDGCTIGLGEPPWLRYAQSRTEARLALDGQRTGHLIFRPEAERPLSAELTDLSASGIGAFLPHASAHALEVHAIYPADLHLPSGAAAVCVQVRSVLPTESAAQWRVGCRFEAPDSPVRSLIKDFLVHAQRQRRISVRGRCPSG